jgi:hypothetical protein
MTQPKDELNDIVDEQPATRLGRLLDRADVMIGSVGLAIWRAVIDGFAACGRAECAMPIEAEFNAVAEQSYVRNSGGRSAARRNVVTALTSAVISGTFMI